MKNKVDLLESYLDELITNPICELNYQTDYELLLAIMLSAQTTDKRVNEVTKILFTKYKTINDLKLADINEISEIIKPIGTFNKKAIYIKKISTLLVDKYNSNIPNNREIIESLPGVGRKTTNVFLSVIYNVPTIAVDTHVERVSKRLELVKQDSTPYEIEVTLMKLFKKENWSKRHHQMVLFGRYYCKAINPKCDNCKLKGFCKNKKEQ